MNWSFPLGFPCLFMHGNDDFMNHVPTYPCSVMFLDSYILDFYPTNTFVS